MTILDEIFAAKRREVAARRQARPLAQVMAEAAAAPAPLGFAQAVARRDAPALIAEIKRASPSRGVLVNDFDPLRLARLYHANGAAAISVLTDEPYFRGSLDDLRQVRALELGLPLLRKDFIFDPYQVYEARAAGADAVLLIAAYLPPALLAELHALICALGMAALVEIHNRAELEAILPVNPTLIGVNNRDLRDFTVRIETTLELRPHVPPGVCLVAESGIHTPQDVARLAEAGVDAILVGEGLVTAPDVGAQVRLLAGKETATKGRTL